MVPRKDLRWWNAERAQEMLKDRVRTKSYRSSILNNKHLVKDKIVRAEGVSLLGSRGVTCCASCCVLSAVPLLCAVGCVRAHIVFISHMMSGA